MAVWSSPFHAAANTVMGLLQPQLPPHQNNHRFDDQSERDLLIRLSVQMEHLKRTVSALVVAVGLMLAGIVPFSLILAFYAAVLWTLWRGAP